MLLGYARVSTVNQNFDLQIDALKQLGVLEENIYKDISSGVKAKRENLTKLFEVLRTGDTLIVWKIDRIARNVPHLSKMIQMFQKKEIVFKSIKEPFIDTSSPHGSFIFNIFAALSQFERDLISERTKAGLESAKKRGRILGKPKGLSADAIKKAKYCAFLYKEGKSSIEEMIKITGISKTTFYKYLRYENVEIGKNYNI